MRFRSPPQNTRNCIATQPIYIEISSNRDDLPITTPNTSGGSNQAGSTWTAKSRSGAITIGVGFCWVQVDRTRTWNIGFTDSNLNIGGDGTCSLFVLQTGTIRVRRSPFFKKESPSWWWLWYHTTQTGGVDVNPSRIESSTWKGDRGTRTREMNPVEESWKFLQNANELTSHHSTHITYKRGNTTPPHVNLKMLQDLSSDHLGGLVFDSSSTPNLIHTEGFNWKRNKRTRGADRERNPQA